MAIRFSTGTCNLYQYPDSPFSSNPSVHNLSGSNQAADHINYWYTQVGLTRYKAWTDFDVFPEDFLDEAFCGAHPRCDLNPAGGSDVPEIYWFQGHGADHQIFVTRGGVDLRNRAIWGNGAGNLQFLFLMACSTMPLADLSSWVAILRVCIWP